MRVVEWYKEMAKRKFVRKARVRKDRLRYIGRSKRHGPTKRGDLTTRDLTTSHVCSLIQHKLILVQDTVTA